MCNKLKIMFSNVIDFNEFKEICKTDNIEYYTYIISSDKTTTVVLKGLIRLPIDRICESIESQGLKTVSCREMSTHTKDPIYRITFVPRTTLAQINHIRYIKHIKI